MDSGSGEFEGDGYLFRSLNTGESASTIRALGSGGKPVLEAETDAADGLAVHGVASGPGFGEAGQFGQGSGTGVEGLSRTGTGVRGTSVDGPGIHGQSTTGPGGLFQSDSGLALEVAGRALFSTAGTGNVAQGQSSAFVASPAITANSHVSVTLVGNPGPRQLGWVQRAPGSGFTVHLTSSPGAKPKTPFTYLVVEYP